MAIDGGDITIAVATGVTAIAAALLGNRYIHRLDVMREHHHDLADQVLVPWKQQAARSRTVLGRLGLPDLLGYDYSAGKYQPALGPLVGTLPHGFPPSTPLWDVSRSHWSDLHAQWEDLERRRIEIANRLAEFTYGLVERVGALPAGSRWYVVDEARPWHGPLVAGSVFLKALAQREEITLQRMPWTSKQMSGENMVLVVAGGGELAVARDTVAFETLENRVRDLLSDSAVHAGIGRLEDESEEIRTDLTAFGAALDKACYDKNLPKSCSFCPRFFLP